MPSGAGGTGWSGQAKSGMPSVSESALSRRSFCSEALEESRSNAARAPKSGRLLDCLISSNLGGEILVGLGAIGLSAEPRLRLGWDNSSSGTVSLAGINRFGSIKCGFASAAWLAAAATAAGLARPTGRRDGAHWLTPLIHGMASGWTHWPPHALFADVAFGVSSPAGRLATGALGITNEGADN